MVKDIHISNFDYSLPDEKIARFPLQQRDACKLIVSDGEGGISHHTFVEVPELIDRDTLMICNETRVINARIEFHKSTGARIEVFLLEPHAPADYAVSFAATDRCSWICLVGNRKKWKEGPVEKRLHIDGAGLDVTLSALIVGDAPGNGQIIEFSWDNPSVSFAEIVEAAGQIPIPPYLKRESMESDSSDYQTVFSRVQGSVAAPTAGLHFTDTLMSRLEHKGVEVRKVTLHVGAGTFQPVKSETIGDHPMHTETFNVDRTVVSELLDAVRGGRTVLAVGTTSVRTLESLPYLGMLIMEGREDLHIDQWMAYREECAVVPTADALQAILDYMDSRGVDSLTASTAIMIAPGFRWRIVGRMITNFHQPQSTLLLLVSSFLNMNHPEPSDSDDLQWRKVYREALGNDYRFLSYGDACLFTPLR